MKRRDFLRAVAALTAAGFPLRGLFAAEPTATTTLSPTEQSQAFDYAWLKGQARALANAVYQPPVGHLPDAVKALAWDQYMAIKYRADRALWARDNRRFQVQFFHLGLYYLSPVRLYEVVDGRAQELAYDAAMFDYGESGLQASNLPKDLGFAGFRMFFHTDLEHDIVSFLGASYFRAVGGEKQYGLSARGLAIDTGMGGAEEFPAFTALWLERPAPDAGTLTVYALMDSPSIAGAYRFIIHPAATLVMDVDAALYPRKEIARLGVAPLTSMFQYGENDRRMANDWRPEIHDSDGLSMWTGSGEWIWRPLVNPASLRFNAFLAENPRGFGLLQRDRNFDNYQDHWVFYDRRPSLWVEPTSGWGKGAIHLVEIPTVDETFDNIVTFWNPADKPQPGQELLFSYRLHWGARMPVTPRLAQVVATRTGVGGVVGRKRTHFSWRFVVDFAGGDLPMLGKGVELEPVITASRGQIDIPPPLMPPVQPLEAVRGYRAMFELIPTDDSLAPIDLRLYLRADGQTLTETWLYQWTPPTQRTF
jgi:periplasmic glucans biosynthesis protein